MAAYSPDLAANAFIYKASQVNVPVDHMKLQKLVFFLHAWSLAQKGQSLVQGAPEAWTYGPVWADLYHELKRFGAQAVREYIPVLNPQTMQRTPLVPNFNDASFWQSLDQVWSAYGKLSAVQLSDLTHEVGSPWYTARTQKQKVMNNAEIAQYYRAKLV